MFKSFMAVFACCFLMGVAPGVVRAGDFSDAWPATMMDDADATVGPVVLEAMPPDKYAGLVACDAGSGSVFTDGERVAGTVGAASVEDMLFSDVPVVLTPKEQYAVEIVAPWQDQTQAGVQPIAAPGGAVQFAYGMERPSVVCAVLQITDIELQAGEIIQSVNIGDSVRWVIEPTVSGPEIPHLLVKPLDVGLNTSLAVATDKRMYHFRLRSTREDFMARVSFAYPAEAAAKFEAMKAAALAKREAEIERDTIPETREYLGSLDFDYRVSGKARWKPTRVYNDGIKTVIEMPDAVSQDDAPALLVLRSKRGLVRRKDEAELVNYRVHGGRYIVDSVFEKAMLVVGVGRNQVRVVIERGKGANDGY